jgi:hypothetical protein
MGGGITLNHFLVLSLIVFSLGLFTVLKPISTTLRSRFTAAASTTGRFLRFS